MGTQYTLAHKSLDIYIAGCKGDAQGGHCPGCHNPESWNFDAGRPYDGIYFRQIAEQIDSFGVLIENIMIFGGEPLHSDHDELRRMLCDMQTFERPIWLFTRYEIDEVPETIKEHCDYIKCGAYRQELVCENNVQFGIRLATSNQNIYKTK